MKLSDGVVNVRGVHVQVSYGRGGQSVPADSPSSRAHLPDLFECGAASQPDTLEVQLSRVSSSGDTSLATLSQFSQDPPSNSRALLHLNEVLTPHEVMLLLRR